MKTHKYVAKGSTNLDNAYKVIYMELRPLFNAIKDRDWQIFVYQNIDGHYSSSSLNKWDAEHLPTIMVSVGQHHIKPILHSDTFNQDSTYNFPVSPNNSSDVIRMKMRGWVRIAVTWVKTQIYQEESHKQAASERPNVNGAHSVIHDANGTIRQIPWIIN